MCGSAARRAIFWVSYAVKPVKMITPMMLMMKSKALLRKKVDENGYDDAEKAYYNAMRPLAARRTVASLPIVHSPARAQ
jgi:hypothetical protein